MSTAKRKKPTKSEAKARKAKRQQAVSAAKPGMRPAGAKKSAAGVTTPAPPTPKNPAAKYRVLHIQSGTYAPDKIHKSFRTKEWQEVRLDDKPDVNPDIISQIFDLRGIPSDSFEAVFSAHSLPKLYFHQLNQTLSEWMRVLKDEGLVVISVPDIKTACNYIARDKPFFGLYETPVGQVTPMDILYGHRKIAQSGNLTQQHRCGFTPLMMANLMRDVGFCNVNVTIDGFNIWAMGYKLPFEHPKRVEKVVVAASSDKVKEEDLPEITAKSKVVGAKPEQHPGYLGKDKLSDELDISPLMWTPLELKKP